MIFHSNPLIDSFRDSGLLHLPTATPSFVSDIWMNLERGKSCKKLVNVGQVHDVSRRTVDGEVHSKLSGVPGCLRVPKDGMRV